MSCKLLESLAGNDKDTTVDALWADVPAFTGATKTDMKLPLGARLILRAAMRGKVSFIAFTTDKPPQDVQAFLLTGTHEGCRLDSRMTKAALEIPTKRRSRVAVCFFTHKIGDKQEGLGNHRRPGREDQSHQYLLRAD